MPIFDDFRDAIAQAIEDYKNEKRALNKPMPTHRLNDLGKLETILQNSQREDNQNAVYLRGYVVEFIGQIEVGFLGSIFSAFDSDLRKKLNSVLARPQYSKSMLKAKEAAEAKARQIAIMRDNTFIMEHLNGEKVIALINQVELLEKNLKTEKNTVTELQIELEGKNEMIDRLSARCETLKAENDLLKQHSAISENASNSRKPALFPHV